MDRDADDSPIVLLPLAIAIGLAFFAALLQAGSRLPLHYPVVYLVLLLLPFVSMPPQVRARWSSLGDVLVARTLPSADGWNLALWGLAIAGALIRLLATFAPEAGMDALGMHLLMPSMLARDHAWMPAQSGFVWAWMPMAVDWIYALAYVPGGEAAARLINFSADLMLLMGCAGIARLAAGVRAGAIAAALYSTCPLTYLLTSSLFVENLWALWLGAALALMTSLHWRNSTWRTYAACGLLWGAALAAKTMTLFWLPLALYFAYGQFRSEGRSAVRPLAIVGAVALAVGGVPYAVAWWEAGNPVFPFMNHIFQSPLYPSSAFESPYHQPVNWRILFDLTFATGNYLEALPGSFGLAWLALLPAGLLGLLVGGGRWMRALVVVSVFVAGLTLWLTSYLRYIAPMLPVWAVLTSIGLRCLRWNGAHAAVAAITVACGLAGLVLFAGSTWWYRALPARGPLDPSEYRQWEAVMRPEARLVQRANDLGLRNVLWLGR
ncbi:MAG TPA: hypothetical protein VNM48_04230, partial [Chloroflexota bacterium]|nr:hypothetical protein [Chloroflexota bacterium]